jgi:hypothetical protein
VILAHGYLSLIDGGRAIAGLRAGVHFAKRAHPTL